MVQHTNQQQYTQEKQQGVELNEADVVQDRIMILLFTHEGRDQEHDSHTSQETQHRRNGKQHVGNQSQYDGG